MFCQRLAYENDCDPVPRVIQTRFSVSRRASGRHRAGRLALVLLHGGDVNQIGLGEKYYHQKYSVSFNNGDLSITN